jgi:cell division protein FtsI (penicillin-binding protein 3)
MPAVKKGSQKDLGAVFAGIGLAHTSQDPLSDWVDVGAQDSTVVFSASRVRENLRNGRMPDVTGMGLRDAVFLLENAGLRVRISGSGTIRKQSKEAGARFTKGDLITIELS